MKRIIWMLLLIATALVAKVDYSEMSNQELLALMGYVAPKNQAAFEKELNSRKPFFTKQEREKYRQNSTNIPQKRKQ